MIITNSFEQSGQADILNSKSKMRIIIVNFHNIKAKRDSLWNFLSNIEPEIIIATETCDPFHKKSYKFP